MNSAATAHIERRLEGPAEGRGEPPIGPADITNVGDDTYRLMARGHHDVHAFMKAVRAAGYSWPLGMPRHVWLRAGPVRNGFHPIHGDCDFVYVDAEPRSRGAFAATYVDEAYGADGYETLTSQGSTAPDAAGSA